MSLLEALLRQEMDIVADLIRADQECECPVDAPGKSLVVLTAEEVAGTSLQDRLLQRLQQAAPGQRSEHALWTL